MPAIDIERKWAGALGFDYTHGNALTPLIDGEAAFKAIHDAIQTATSPGHFVYLLAWWLDLDAPLLPPYDARANPAATLRSLLEARAHAGVEIRVMVWLNPGRIYPGHDTPEQIANLVKAGKSLDEFLGALDADPSSVRVRNPKSHIAIVQWINALPHAAAILDGLGTFVASSHHQKLLCVRGTSGLVSLAGGVDVNMDRVRVVNDGKGEPLHDVHCVVRGPAAADLVHVFAQRWDGHPESRDLQGGKLLGRSVTSADAPGVPGQLVRVAATYNHVRVRGLRREACKVERGIQDGLLGAIRSATRFIYLEDQYLVSLTVADALGNALQNTRLQHITVLITHPAISDFPQVWSRRKEFIERVRKNEPYTGVSRLHVYYLWDPHARGFSDHTYVHAKTWVFDDELAYIGTANVNNRGLSSDSEVGVFACDKPWSAVPRSGFAHDLRRRLWKEHLGVDVVDAIADRKRWDEPLPASRVLPYDPDEGKDDPRLGLIPWDIIDPDASGLKECQYAVPPPRRMRRLPA